MATAAQISEQLRVAVAAAKQERTVRRAVLATALQGTDALAISDARHDVALIEGVLSSLQRAFSIASGLEVA